MVEPQSRSRWSGTFVRDVFALKGHLGIRYRKDLCDCDYTDKRKKVLADLYKWFQARDNPEANGEEEESEMPESDNLGHDEDSNRGYQCLGVQGWERDENDTSISVNDVTVTSALRTYSWGPVDGTPRISIGISPRNGLVILETRLRRETNPKKMEMTSRRCKCLCRQYYTYIPVKLLHGPWTEDQLSFLEALLESGASLDADNKSHREIAKKGLTDAIWKDNYRAVDLLISEPMESQYSERYERNYFEPSWCEAEFAMDIRTDFRE